MERYHKPVLLREAIKALEIVDGWYIDATIGDGGHSLGIIEAGGKILGIDVDPEALGRVQNRFDRQGLDKRYFKLVQGNFNQLKNLILPASRGEQTDLKDQEFKGIIFDLGVSSLQLETPNRGFSFGKVSPLDMRMGPSLSVQALDLINGLNKGELNELFSKLGEEKFARRITEALVRAREITQLDTIKLANLVEKVYRQAGIKYTKIHPATKVFQALRIAVNDELNVLREALEQAREVIEKNGHIVIISFHSLEDRIVKDCFKKWQAMGFGQVVTKKPIVATKEEILGNPSSRSAKMRIFKK